MNILLATDNNFVQHCCVAVTSVLCNNPNTEIFIFTEGLYASNEKILSNQAEKYNGIIHFCIVDRSIVSLFPMPSNADAHITIATYYRLFVEKLLPETIHKIIYMDCDMVVRQSFRDLWSSNVDGYAMGAVYQPIDNSQEADKLRLMIPSERGYFNAGLLLINLNYWRANNVTDRLLDFIKNHYSLVHQHDQDVLNAVLYSETIPLNYTWNYISKHINIKKLSFPHFVNYSLQINDPANIHFVSAPKPWDFGCNHPYKKEYYKYLAQTTFKSFKPKFEWHKFYGNILRISLLNFICKLDILEIRKILKSR